MGGDKQTNHQLVLIGPFFFKLVVKVTLGSRFCMVLVCFSQFIHLKNNDATGKASPEFLVKGAQQKIM